MSEDLKTNIEFDNLPKEFVNRLTRPFHQFLRIEAASGAFLFLFAVIAMVISNSPWGHYFFNLWEIDVGFQWGSFEFTRTLRDWINDGLMTLFFFLIALELKRELVLGELRDSRLAILSSMAAIGGMLVPAGLYLILQSGQPGQHGWGMVMATDTAFVMGCLALLGTRIPQSLRIFMLSLAIFDDIGAILVVTIGYSNHIVWGAIALSVLGFTIVRLMSLSGIRSISLYYLAGGLIWLAVDASGIHATITGIILGLLTPARRWVSDERLYAILNRVIAHPDKDEGSGDTKDRQTLQLAEIASRETLSPVERLEMALHPWVGFVILPLFAFANAGMFLTFSDFGNPITVAVFVGFAFGKPLGILTFSWLMLRSGVAVFPIGMNWRMLVGGSLLGGIGFTMALFIGNLALNPNQFNDAKLGILLASVFSAIAGLALLSRRSIIEDKIPNPL